MLKELLEVVPVISSLLSFMNGGLEWSVTEQLAGWPAGAANLRCSRSSGCNMVIKYPFALLVNAVLMLASVLVLSLACT